MQNETSREGKNETSTARFSEAVAKLARDLVSTAVRLGSAKLQGMNRDVAEIQLKLIGEALVRGPSGELSTARAIDWLNVSIKNLNQVRSAIGDRPILVCTAL